MTPTRRLPRWRPTIDQRLGLDVAVVVGSVILALILGAPDPETADCVGHRKSKDVSRRPVH